MTPAQRTLALIVPSLIIVSSPRAMIWAYLALGGAAAVCLARSRPDVLTRPHLALATRLVLVFAAYGLVSALWSAAPGDSVGKSLALAAIALGAEVLVRYARITSDEARARWIGPLVVAGLAGLALAAFEVVSDQWLTRMAMTLFPGFYKSLEGHRRLTEDVVTWVSETNINRRVGLVTLMLVPLFLAIATAPQVARWRLPMLAFAGLAGAAMIALSGHQSSQVAAVAGILVFGLARLSVPWALRLLAVAFTISTLLVMPIVKVAHDQLKLQEAPWLFNSARDRVAIWGYTANEIVRRPLLGIGADATRAETGNLRAAGKLGKDAGYDSSPSRHAHNAYLQIWYELGAIGAALTLAIGLACLAGIRRLPPGLQAFGVAQFAVTAGMIAFSYSIWQLWYAATIAAGAVALLSVTQREPSP
jgi:hypothetical protein